MGKYKVIENINSINHLHCQLYLKIFSKEFYCQCYNFKNYLKAIQTINHDLFDYKKTICLLILLHFDYYLYLALHIYLNSKQIIFSFIPSLVLQNIALTIF
jgi:hypothetical protein